MNQSRWADLFGLFKTIPASAGKVEVGNKYTLDLGYDHIDESYDLAQLTFIKKALTKEWEIGYCLHRKRNILYCARSSVG